MKNKTVKKELTIRKQPSQDRSREKVHRILEATIRLLETDGFEGITTNHIAKEANLSVASLYQYFPNKHGIIYAVYQKWLHSVLEAFDQVEKAYLLNEDPVLFLGDCADAGTCTTINVVVEARPWIVSIDLAYAGAVGEDLSQQVQCLVDRLH